jgi:hypothetical protein
MANGYNGNPLLKQVNTPIEWTPEKIEERLRCKEDPVYFAKNHIKIVHVDKGLIPFKMYPYQEEIVEKIQNNRRVCVLTARQSGKCVSPNTPIKVRNSITEEETEMSIGDFYEMVKEE